MVISMVSHGDRDHGIKCDFFLRNSKQSSTQCVREKSNRYLNYYVLNFANITHLR